jgi:hypothetical protein
VTRAAALVLLLAAPLATAADGPQRITLRVGEQRALGGYAPVCDDPSVAIITADGGGSLVAKGPGKTLCSLQQPGGRRVYEVVVLAKEEKEAPGGKG